MVDRFAGALDPNPSHPRSSRSCALWHTLSEQRGESQQRIQSVLYHHGCPPRGDLINRGGLQWLGAQALTAPAREQVNVALGMIDTLDQQLAPIVQWLRLYARH